METLDLTGLKCPLPVLRTQKALVTMGHGARLWVITTDPMSVIDLPHFCAEHGHTLVETKPISSESHAFLIEKGSRIA